MRRARHVLDQHLVVPEGHPDRGEVLLEAELHRAADRLRHPRAPGQPAIDQPVAWMRRSRWAAWWPSFMRGHRGVGSRRMATVAASHATLDVVPEQEEVLLREAVAGICSDFGPEYTQRKAEEGEPPTELWDALAEPRLPGREHPRGVRRRRAGHGGAVDGRRGDLRRGCSLLLIVVSPAIAGSILTRHGTPEQKDRWLRGIGAGTTKIAFAITEPDAGTNSHNLSTSLAARRRRASCSTGRRPTSPASRTPTPCWWWPACATPTARWACPSLAIVDVDAPGFTRTQIPMPYVGPDKQWQLFFEDVEVERGPPDRRRERRPRRGLRRPQPGADHGRLGRRGRRPLRAGQGRRLRARAQRVGRADRHPPGHRRTRWPRPRSSWSWPG